MVHRRLAFVAFAFLAACEGPSGPQGAAGTVGEAGPAGAAGTMGASGPPGLVGTTADGGVAGVAIQASCLSPCHGFNGVVSQFQTSVHYTEYLSNVSSATPETAWTAPGAACGNCHAID